MWILPNNLSSAYAQECGVSKKELSSILASESCLLWRSKPLFWKIWLGKWNKVYWLPHLFGRILKPSLGNDFINAYTASLEDSHASLFRLPETGWVPKTQDIYGHISNTEWRQLDLFGDSSKMSQAISSTDTSKSGSPYKNLVIRLKKEYSQRKKLARLICGSDSLSSLWTTPLSEDLNRNTSFAQGGMPLSLVKGNYNRKGLSEKSGNGLGTEVKNWGTPRTSMLGHVPGKMNKSNLEDQVQNWKTPQARDYKYPDKKDSANFARKESRSAIDLNSQVLLWPTPIASNGGSNKGSKAVTERGHGTNLVGAVTLWPTPTFGGNNQGTIQEWGGSGNPFRGRSLQEQDKAIMNTLALLNPAWVIQLMGTTIGKTFFAWQEMESLNNPHH